MRIFLAAAIGFMMLAFSSPGRAACAPPGDAGCGPSAGEERAKVERLLDAAFSTPHAIVSLEKLDGRNIETNGRGKYEMRFAVVLRYSGDKLQCREALCPELHNYLLEIDAAAKTATVAGWIFFDRVDQGWQ